MVLCPSLPERLGDIPGDGLVDNPLDVEIRNLNPAVTGNISVTLITSAPVRDDPIKRSAHRHGVNTDPAFDEIFSNQARNALDVHTYHLPSPGIAVDRSQMFSTLRTNIL